MLISIGSWFQVATTTLDVRTLVEVGTLVFLGGAGWQQLRDIKTRVIRIENKIFNGDSKK